MNVGSHHTKRVSPAESGALVCGGRAMPTRAPRRCTHGGCRNYAEREGRCQEHSLSRSGRHSQTTTKRGLGHTWRKLAARAIRDQPWCTDCGLNGDPDSGETRDPDNPLTGDHIVPRSVAPHLALDPTNVAVRCLRCNDRKGQGNPRRARPTRQ